MTKFWTDWHNQLIGLVALAILVAGFVFAPQDRLDHVGHALAAFGATTGGAMIYSALASLAMAGLRWALARVPSNATPMPQRISSSKDGSSSLDALGLVLLVGGVCLAWLRHLVPALLVCVVASGASGCGASALAMQARAATIAGVGLGSVGQQIHDDRTADLDACTDTACEDAGEAKWAPAVAALESVRTALTTWVDALDVARQAGEPDSDILGALLVAVSHLAHEWNDLAAALRGVGVPLPDLPPAVSALLGSITAA